MRRLPAPVLTARQWLVDAVVAALVAVGQVAALKGVAHGHGGRLDAGGIALMTVAAAALAFRRRFPVAVMAVAFAATWWYSVSGSVGGPIWLPLIISFGTAVYLRRRVAAIVCLVGGYVAFLWLPVPFGWGTAPSAVAALGLALWLATMLGVAELVRMRSQRAEALRQRHAEELRRVASEQRLGLARDLHDIVAHHISIINVQANTALHLVDRQPDRARSALVTINEVSRQALVELRATLGVLRGVDDPAPRAPAPSLTRLDELVDHAAAAGLTVTVEGPAAALNPPADVDVVAWRGLPADVDVVAYRIVQEALTNVTRHSTSRRATVAVDRTGDRLVVRVDDDGPARRGAAAGGTGSGLAGMAERVAALGGTVTAGPRPDGGFRVRAELTLVPTEAP